MQKQKNILVFTTWSYKDGLIQGATIPYLKIISEIINGTIYLICLEQEGLQLTDEEAETAKQELSQFRIRLIRFKYHKNKIRASLDWAIRIIYILYLLYSKRINYLHPICTPAAAIAWIVTKFKKVSLVVDSLEPHAEMMAEVGIWNRKSTLFKLLFYLEKKVVRRADKLIAVSKNISLYIKDHYHIDPPVEKIFYRPLCVNPDLFIRKAPDYRLLGWDKKEARIIGIYTGKIGGMYYEEEFYIFIKECIRFWKGDFHLILCTSMDKTEIEHFLESHGIKKKFFTVTFVHHSRIPAYLSLADFGMSFSRPSEARKYGCPTKNAEYWSIGLPVIATNAILDDTNDINNNSFLGVVINEGSFGHLDNELSAISNLIDRKEELIPLIRSFAIRERSFERVRLVYEQIYVKPANGI